MAAFEDWTSIVRRAGELRCVKMTDVRDDKKKDDDPQNKYIGVTRLPNGRYMCVARYGKETKAANGFPTAEEAAEAHDNLLVMLMRDDRALFNFSWDESVKKPQTEKTSRWAN
jgi:hypothetical protein